MTVPPPWVGLSLRVALDAHDPSAAFVAQARALGVSASVTPEWIQLGPGLLARVEPVAFPDFLVDDSLAEGPPQLGPATLWISGGTNEVERMTHQAAATRAARDHAAQLALALGVGGDARAESAASRKITALTATLRALAPLASAAILPYANHIAIPVARLERRAAQLLDASSSMFPLWAYLKIRDDADVRTLTTVGMWPFALPDVAIAWPGGADRDERVRALGELQHAMVADGWWPENGARFTTSVGELRLERVWGAVWASREGDPVAPAARARFGRLAQLAEILGPTTLDHAPLGDKGLAIERLYRRTDVSYAMTNGLSDAPQRGGSAAEENDFVELVVTSRELGPWADGWLRWASTFLRREDGGPLRPYERLVLPAPAGGIAGVIVWPMGRLNPGLAGEPTTHLWELVPFTPRELEAFRAEPAAQQAWMDARLERGDLAAIQARWTAPPG